MPLALPTTIRKTHRSFVQGTSLFCASGSPHLVGKSSLVPSGVGATFGAFTAVVRPSDRRLSEFLAIYAQSPSGRAALAALGRGIGFNNLETSDLANLPIPMPPVQHQYAVVAAVNDMDGRLNALAASLRTRLHLHRSHAQHVLRRLT